MSKRRRSARTYVIGDDGNPHRVVKQAPPRPVIQHGVPTKVAEGIDASRRAAWAQKYAADERVAELERVVEALRAELAEEERRCAREHHWYLAAVDALDLALDSLYDVRRLARRPRIRPRWKDSVPEARRALCMSLLRRRWRMAIGAWRAGPGELGEPS